MKIKEHIGMKQDVGRMRARTDWNKILIKSQEQKEKLARNKI
jgi:hypothetical protein